MTLPPPKVDSDGNFKGSLAKYATGLRIDATGGWFDAGDYLHFTETTSYTVAMMLQAVASFPAQVGAHGQVSFSGEAKFGLDFLRQMWNERTRTLYLQVGTGEANSNFLADHDIWRLPQADDHYQGTNPQLPVHQAPASVPCGQAGLADQPEPGRPPVRRLRALLPGLPRHQACLREELPSLGRDDLLDGRPALEGPA